jgi:hypothetical protein
LLLRASFVGIMSGSEDGVYHSPQNEAISQSECLRRMISHRTAAVVPARLQRDGGYGRFDGGAYALVR